VRYTPSSAAFQRGHITFTDYNAYVEVHTSRGSFTLDRADWEKVKDWRWNLCKFRVDGPTYVTGTPRYLRKMQRLHRVILGLTPSDPAVDHIDGNPLNNRRSNLRLATVSQNNANCKKRRTNKSGYKGVSFSKERQKWAAYIKYENKTYGLGRFDNVEDAARAYDRAAKEKFKEFAQLNFPEEGE